MVGESAFVSGRYFDYDLNRSNPRFNCSYPLAPKTDAK